MVQKVASVTTKAIASDVKDQLGIEPIQAKTSTAQASDGQVNQPQQTQQAEEDKQKNLNETRSNLQKLNNEITKIRQERLQKQQEKKKAEAEKKQEKKQEEQKKNAEPFWKRFMRKGSHEGMKKMGA